jgi:hypothetical protein
MCGIVWQSEALFGTVTLCNVIGNRALLCMEIFINGFMQKVFDKSSDIMSGTEPFSPVTYNPSRRADFCVHQNTAS